MTWNHRVVRTRTHRKFGSETTYDIREVYYRRNGKPYLYSSSAIPAFGNTLTELRETLTLMLATTFKPLFYAKEIKLPVRFSEKSRRMGRTNRIYHTRRTR